MSPPPALSAQPAFSAAPVTVPATIRLRNMPPALRQMAQALWAQFATLDLRINTTLRDVEPDLLAAMPILDGQADNIRHMVAMLAQDIRDEYRTSFKAQEHPLTLRFVNQDQSDRIAQISPSDNATRIIVVPVHGVASFHATLHDKTALQIVDDWMGSVRERFVLVADPSAMPPTQRPEDTHAARQAPLTQSQIAAYRASVRSLNQAMADAMGNLEAQTTLDGLRNALLVMAQRLDRYQSASAPRTDKDGLASYVSPTAEAIAVRQEAIQVEQRLKAQIGNLGLSEPLRHSLRAGLRQLQQARADAPQTAPQIASIMIPRALPLSSRHPLVGTTLNQPPSAHAATSATSPLAATPPLSRERHPAVGVSTRREPPTPSAILPLIGATPFHNVVILAQAAPESLGSGAPHRAVAPQIVDLQPRLPPMTATPILPNLAQTPIPFAPPATHNLFPPQAATNDTLATRKILDAHPVTTASPKTPHNASAHAVMVEPAKTLLAPQIAQPVTATIGAGPIAHGANTVPTMPEQRDVAGLLAVEPPHAASGHRPTASAQSQTFVPATDTGHAPPTPMSSATAVPAHVPSFVPATPVYANTAAASFTQAPSNDTVFHQQSSAMRVTTGTANLSNERPVLRQTFQITPQSTADTSPPPQALPPSAKLAQSISATSSRTSPPALSRTPTQNGSGTTKALATILALPTAARKSQPATAHSGTASVPEKEIQTQFKAAARGACAHCGGGNCAACTRGHLSSAKIDAISAALKAKYG